METLRKICDTVFNLENPKLEHIKIENMPEGLNEDSLILIYRKTQQILRYHIHNLLTKTGGKNATEAV